MSYCLTNALLYSHLNIWKRTDCVVDEGRYFWCKIEPENIYLYILHSYLLLIFFLFVI